MRYLKLFEEYSDENVIDEIRHRLSDFSDLIIKDIESNADWGSRNSKTYLKNLLWNIYFELEEGKDKLKGDKKLFYKELPDLINKL